MLFVPEEARALADDLKAAGVTDVRVVVYVRDPTSYYLSYVQQELKASHRFTAPLDFEYPFLRVITVWRDRYPDLVVRAFDRDQMVAGNVVHDFLAAASTFFGSTISVADEDLVTSNERSPPKA